MKISPKQNVRAEILRLRAEIIKTLGCPDSVFGDNSDLLEYSDVELREILRVTRVDLRGAQTGQVWFDREEYLKDNPGCAEAQLH